MSLVLKCVLEGLAHSCYTVGMLLCACLLCLHRPHVYTAGLHTSAFFFGHAAMHMIDILVQPAIFMSLYYTLTLPEIKFIDYYFGMVSNYFTAKCCNLDCFSRWSLQSKPSLSLRSTTVPNVAILVTLHCRVCILNSQSTDLVRFTACYTAK